MWAKGMHFEPPQTSKMALFCKKKKKYAQIFQNKIIKALAVK